MVKINRRENGTFLLEGGAGDNPKLMGQTLKDGRASLFLDYYLGYRIVVSRNGREYKRAERKSERLGLYLWIAPRTPQERLHNKETLELAKQIRYERGQQLLENEQGYRLAAQKREANFFDYFQGYIDGYTKKDIRMMRIALRRFRDFMRDTPKYAQFQTRITPKQITPDMIREFAGYLQGRSRGEGAKSIYQRFKKVVRFATDHGIFKKKPCEGISIKVDDKTLKKEILSPDEIIRLAATHYTGENTVIRRAFLFCLYTGLRFCDVRDLVFANIDYSNRLLTFEQNKTRGHSTASGVVIPLNDVHLRIAGKPVEGQGRESLVFPLPSYGMCLKALRRWTARAGIEKHISWHCARHSFAVNILNGGANIKTVASLLGHSSLQHTEKYTRAIDSLKEAAINSLPEIGDDDIQGTRQ